jgi:NAD(P)-dependent dehydrogenase (short-subunit alcohol dehydrogenase family)
MAGGTVLITGASTGIGEAAAHHLRDLGFDVLAGVRRDEDRDRLSASGVGAVKLDVTDPGQIEAVRAELGERPLAGLVNNAGIGVAGPLEFMPLDRLRHQLEVNLVGQVAVTQAMLPALRRARGRIVNVTSIGGRMALPLVGPYAASKFGLEAVSDSLRRELRQLGVNVIVIEPGGVKTPIWAKSSAMADEMLAEMPAEGERLYGSMMSALRKQTVKIGEKTGLEPSEVAEAIGVALTKSRPRARYLVGREAKVQGQLAKWLPARMMDRLIGMQLR